MKSNIMSHFRITNDQNKLLPTKLCEISVKITKERSNSQAAIQAIEGNIISSSTVLCCIQNLNLLEGWEEEEIIDKKDSAEGRTSNLPYRNSVVCNVSIPQTIANRGEPLSSKL
ncbi:hypothetical protein GQR58_020914 [Nymphon striatum]|nr:hypothetical protein GQR58_020914 [Nymphon striatum]